MVVHKGYADHQPPETPQLHCRLQLTKLFGLAGPATDRRNLLVNLTTLRRRHFLQVSRRREV
jgi:hypothetical protein